MEYHFHYHKLLLPEKVFHLQASTVPKVPHTQELRATCWYWLPPSTAHLQHPSSFVCKERVGSPSLLDLKIYLLEQISRKIDLCWVSMKMCTGLYRSEPARSTRFNRPYRVFVTQSNSLCTVQKSVMENLNSPDSITMNMGTTLSFCTCR